MPAFRDGVPDGQSEGDGSPETGEHHHVLETARDLDSSPDVENCRERIDVEKPAQKYGYEGSADVDRVEVVLGEGEHGDTDIGEDEVLRHEVEKVEEVFRGLF